MKKKKFLNWIVVIVGMFAIGLLSSFAYFSYILWIGGGQNLTKIEEKHVYIEESQIAGAADRVSTSLLLVFPKTDLDLVQKNLPTLTQNCNWGGKCPVNLKQGLIFTSDGVVLSWFDDLKIFNNVADWKAIGVDGKIYDLEKIGVAGNGNLVKFRVWNNGELLKKPSDRKIQYNWPIPDLADWQNLKVGQKVFAGDLSVADQNLVLSLGDIIYLRRNSTVSDENKNELIFKIMGIKVDGDVLNKTGHFVFDGGGQVIGVIDASGNLLSLT